MHHQSSWPLFYLSVSAFLAFGCIDFTEGFASWPGFKATGPKPVATTESTSNDAPSLSFFRGIFYSDQSPLDFIDSKILAPLSPSPASAELRSYEHNGWNLTYRYKPASKGYEGEAPVLLIHPVGIGLSSWFWEKFLSEWEGPEVYAPNLIGCGVSEGGDPWDPDEKGLSFPLGWAQGCQALMSQVAAESRGTSTSWFFGANKSASTKWTVLSQGGLAPVAVLMAAKYPDQVGRLVMASPPTWPDMTSAVPEAELARNYDFLRSPLWGSLAFAALESRGAIEFFSNAFLFEDRCDERWLDRAEDELGVTSRPPVMAFNAGFCQHRSFQEELESLPQPTLVLAGSKDKRQIERQDYARCMRACRLEVLPGLNVLPWESPKEFAKAVSNFLATP